MKWNREQQVALDRCGRWLTSGGEQVFRLFGFAGTGKTTLARHLVENEPGIWLYGAYTGKAAHVLRGMGCDASTLHSIIYRPSGEAKAKEADKLARRLNQLDMDERRDPSLTSSTDHQKVRRKLERELRELRSCGPSFQLWEASKLADPLVRGIVVDEVSMVDERLGTDLLSFGKKVLVLGDPAQLPPVRGGGFLTNHDPDAMLTQVHRQARNSGVLRLATHLREGGSLEKFDSCQEARILRPRDRDYSELLRRFSMNADQVLCATNKMRRAINARYRNLAGRSPEPEPGDRVICLRNDRMLGLLNGSQWAVETAFADWDVMTAQFRLTSDDGQDEVEIESWLHHFAGQSERLDRMGPERRDIQEFDWAYAITVHKAQGSQWRRVTLRDQPRAMRQHRRKWLYTGVTRASEAVVVVTE